MGLASRNLRCFFSNPPEAHGAEFIAATGGHRWNTTAHRLTLGSSGVMDRSPKNGNFLVWEVAGNVWAAPWFRDTIPMEMSIVDSSCQFHGLSFEASHDMGHSLLDHMMWKSLR